MKPSFKMEPKETKPATWHEAYVSFDDGKSWYAIGGGSSPIETQKTIEWYKEKYHSAA